MRQRVEQKHILRTRGHDDLHLLVIRLQPGNGRVHDCSRTPPPVAIEAFDVPGLRADDAVKCSDTCAP
jgi:hypothetical protein